MAESRCSGIVFQAAREEKMPNPFAFMDATAQAGLVHRREVRPLELLEAAVARIEKLKPALNAVVTRMYDQARADIDYVFAGHHTSALFR